MLWRRRQPLMLAPTTYNTQHPHYDARAARNHPGSILGPSRGQHPVLAEIAALGDGGNVAAERWEPTYAALRAELERDPDGARLFADRHTLETQLDALGRTYRAQYNAGWVNLDDGLFLYWLVRRLRPKTIVQTGVCNGFSCAMLALALARNGGPGEVHAIDLPHVFNPSDAAWTRRGHVYGVIIPEGRSSGWLV